MPKLVTHTFPLMDGGLVPADYAQLQPFIRNWFENVAAEYGDHLLASHGRRVLALWLAGSRAGYRARHALHGLLAVARRNSLGVGPAAGHADPVAAATPGRRRH
jgi:heme A synthase